MCLLEKKRQEREKKKRVREWNAVAIVERPATQACERRGVREIAQRRGMNVGQRSDRRCVLSGFDP